MRTTINRAISFALLIVTYLQLIRVIAQSPAEFPDHGIKSHPAPPEMFQFLKQGEFNISLYNGLPEISIPVYTINDGKIEIPITLTYLPGGIKVSEEASWTGLGWDLQFGSIVQITNDRDDFCEVPMKRPDYFHHSDPSVMLWTEAQMNFQHPVNVNYTPFPFWRLNGTILPENGSMRDFSNLLEYGGTEEESEPDIMKASFFGHYLEFIKDPESEDFLCLNRKNYVIRKTELPSEFGWEITTPQGIHYYFEEVTCIDRPRIDWVSHPMSYSNAPSTLNLGVIELSDQTQFGNGSPENIMVDLTFRSRIWRITKITDYHGNTVLFNYDQEKTPKYDQVSDFTWRVFRTFRDQAIITSCNDCGPLTVGNTLYGRPAVVNPTIFYGENHVKYTTRTLGTYLKEIVFTQGKVEFITSQREDYKNSKKLDRIRIICGDDIIRTFDFDYEYFTSNYEGNGIIIPFKTLNELTKRLKLVSVSSSCEPPFRFQYNQTPLPPKNSAGIDYWGFSNGRIYNNSIAPNFLRFKVFNPAFHAAMMRNSSNHSADIHHSKAGLLEEITYPTYGKTSFEYELNEFFNYNNGYKIPDIDYIPDLINPDTSSLSSGFGLRIKSQTQSDGINPDKKTVYFYDGGKLQVPTQFIYEFNDFIYLHNQESGTLERYYFENYETRAGNYFTPGFHGSEDRVGYDKVTLAEVHNGDFNNGKNEYFFINSPDIVQSFQTLNLLNIPSFRSQQKNGTLLSEKTYKTLEGNTMELVLQKDYSYKELEVRTPVYGLKHSFQGVYGYWDYGSGQLINTSPAYVLAYYPMYTTHDPVITIHTTEFYDHMTKTISSTDSLSYDPNKLLTLSRSMKLSEGGWKTDYYFYPHQAQIIQELTSPEKNAVQKLTDPDINRVEEIIKKSEFVDYLLVREDIQAYKIFDSFSLTSNVKTHYGNQEIVEKMSFTQYDQKGNVIEYKEKADLPVTLLWGYNFSYIIAIIENAGYEQVMSEINISYDQLQILPDEALTDVFNQLRNQLTGCRITSYTYKPMTGMTAKTDPDGYTTSYSYDECGRLSTIRRRDGAIIQHFDYRFKEQP